MSLPVSQKGKTNSARITDTLYKTVKDSKLNFDELAEAITTRKHIGIPCDTAQDIDDLKERLQHIANCGECKRMYKDLEEKVKPRK